MRLAKPKKKGLLGLIFSRFFLIALLLVLEVAIIVAVYGYFKLYLPYFRLIQAIFSVFVILFLFNSDMDNSAKLTWMVIIALFPIPGSIFLAFTQTNAGHRSVRKRSAGLIEMTKHALVQDPGVLEKVSQAGDGSLHEYVNSSGSFPICGGTEVTYFPLGELKFQAMLEELKKAEKYIFMEYFIIEEGEMFGSILDILAEKAASGVDVRIMYDGLCEITTLPSKYPALLGKLGIKCKLFSPVKPFLSTHYNYRDHRKILVIDGKVAFNGGVNLADEYINRIERFGHWKDTAVMLRGSAVKSFLLLFLQMWNLDEAEPDFSILKETEDFSVDNAQGFVMPFGDSPLDGDKVGENVYMDLLNRANTYVHIMSPYLILDGELASAIKYAAGRGVDVKLILPGIPDKKLAYSLAKSHYYSLVSAGVRIFEYTPGFVHAKVAVSDDSRAVVGTINFDYRSLYHHFECATYMSGTPCIENIEADFEDTLSKCREVTFETIKREKLSYKLTGGLLKFLAPLF